MTDTHHFAFSDKLKHQIGISNCLQQEYSPNDAFYLSTQVKRRSGLSHLSKVADFVHRTAESNDDTCKSVKLQEESRYNLKDQKGTTSLAHLPIELSLIGCQKSCYNTNSAYFISKLDKSNLMQTKQAERGKGTYGTKTTDSSNVEWRAGSVAQRSTDSAAAVHRILELSCQLFPTAAAAHGRAKWAHYKDVNRINRSKLIYSSRIDAAADLELAEGCAEGRLNLSAASPSGAVESQKGEVENFDKYVGELESTVALIERYRAESERDRVEHKEFMHRVREQMNRNKEKSQIVVFRSISSAVNSINLQASQPESPIGEGSSPLSSNSRSLPKCLTKAFNRAAAISTSDDFVKAPETRSTFSQAALSTHHGEREVLFSSISKGSQLQPSLLTESEASAFEKDYIGNNLSQVYIAKDLAPSLSYLCSVCTTPAVQAKDPPSVHEIQKVSNSLRAEAEMQAKNRECKLEQLRVDGINQLVNAAESRSFNTLEQPLCAKLCSNDGRKIVSGVNMKDGSLVEVPQSNVPVVLPSTSGGVYAVPFAPQVGSFPLGRH